MFPFPRQGSSHPQSLDVLLTETFPGEAAHRKCSPAGCIHEAPRNTQLNSWQRTCQCSQDLPSHSCQTLHVRYHSQQKSYEQGSSFVEVMRHCSYYHELKLVIWWPWCSPAIVSLPSSDNTHLIAKWQRMFPLPSIKSSAVPKPSGIKSWKNLVLIY